MPWRPQTLADARSIQHHWPRRKTDSRCESGRMPGTFNACGMWFNGMIRVTFQCYLTHGGRASFWGDPYTLRKWTRNLYTKIRKCVPTKRNREKNDAFQKHLHRRVHHTIQRNKMLFANACLPWSFASCVVWDVLRPSTVCCVHCTHRFHEFAYTASFFMRNTRRNWR